MRYLFFILLLLTLVACGQESKNDSSFSPAVEIPVDGVDPDIPGEPTEPVINPLFCQSRFVGQQQLVECSGSNITSLEQVNIVAQFIPSLPSNCNAGGFVLFNGAYVHIQNNNQGTVLTARVQYSCDYGNGYETRGYFEKQIAGSVFNFNKRIVE